jgi:UDP-N-acetylmuramate dehydrogenase
MSSIIKTDVKLAPYTTYNIGGPAKWFAEAENEKDIADIVKEYENMFPDLSEKKIFILGGGANVLFSDDGYEGLVIKISVKGIKTDSDGTITAGAGESLKDVVLAATDNELSGLEWAAGIPGSFGGAIRGNAGAFGGEMKDSIVSVESLRIDDANKMIGRDNKECRFGYRTSIFKNDARDEVIIYGKVKLAPGIKKDIEAKCVENMNYRQDKQPIEFPSAGSTFKNVDVKKITESRREEWVSVIKTDPFPVVPAAFLISEAELKGYRVGGAMISDKHPNFFINVGGATSNDVKRLIAETKKRIKEKFGIEMEEEIQIVE